MYEITIQRMIPKDKMPDVKLLKHWAEQTLVYQNQSAELNIRVVDKKEMTALNSQYRQKNKPTNVLSFPFDMPVEAEEELVFLGDIVICADVVNEEAKAQNISENYHWAHMVVHGTLHLLGYDHETDEDADIMEPEEGRILESLGFPNPYYKEPQGN